MNQNMNNNEYMEFLKTREKKDIILIKEELCEDISSLKKNVKKFKIYSFILKNKILNKVFGKKMISISPDVEIKYNKKKELYNIVDKYLKEMDN